MAEPVYATFKQKAAFAKAKLSQGPPPSGEQTAAFLRDMTNTIRPQIGTTPQSCRDMLEECFRSVSWDVRTNRPLPGSRPCAPAELVQFLDTAASRLQIGIRTAGWGQGSIIVPAAAREQVPKPATAVAGAAGRGEGGAGGGATPAAAAPSTRAVEGGGGVESSAGNMDAAAGASGVGAGALQQGVASDGSGSAAAAVLGAATTPTADEDLFIAAELDEAAAIAAVEKEIEEQIERNYYINLERQDRSRR
eukprot:SAG22_NODE_6608_length_832_cov_0.818554_1_plen_250_part_00